MEETDDVALDQRGEEMPRNEISGVNIKVSNYVRCCQLWHNQALTPHNPRVAYLLQVSQYCHLCKKNKGEGFFDTAEYSCLDMTTHPTFRPQTSCFCTPGCLGKKIGREAASFCVFKKANRFFSAPLNDIPQQEPHRRLITASNATSASGPTRHPSFILDSTDWPIFKSQLDVLNTALPLIPI